MKKYLMLIVLGMLCAAPINLNAASTTEDNPCNVWKLSDSIDAATYVVVTRLEDYLPNNRGKHEVIMSLLGDIPVGAYVDNVAPPLIKPEDNFGMSGGVAIGSYVLFMGQDYTRNKMYYHLDFFKCDGRFELHDSEKVGYSVVGHVANRLLKSKKALKINGGM